MPKKSKVNVQSVKDLKPAEYNPRLMSEEKLSMLKKSMQKFGDLSGIVVNLRTGNLVGGHQRTKHFDPKWKITKRAAEDKTGTVAQGVVHTPWGDWAYREVDWPIKTEKIANIAANKHQGEFDMEALQAIVNDINPDNIGRDLMGFDVDELDFLKSFSTFGDGNLPGELPPLGEGGDDGRANRIILACDTLKDKAKWLSLLGIPKKNHSKVNVTVTLKELKELKD